MERIQLEDLDFIKKLAGQSDPNSVGIMPLDEINSQIKDVMPEFTKRGTSADEFCILGIKEIKEYEGLLKIITLEIIPPGPKILSRKRSHTIVCDILPRVVVPIVFKMGDEIYLLLNTQKRVPLGGKATIEVLRGSIELSTDRSLAESLVNRKIENIDNYFDFVEFRNLGYFWNNTGNSGTRVPIQAIFLVSKKGVDLANLKSGIKLNTKFDLDPEMGPPKPAVEPIFRTYIEVLERLEDILSLPLPDKMHFHESNPKVQDAYINDLFSYSALKALEQSIQVEGMPF